MTTWHSDRSQVVKLLAFLGVTATTAYNAVFLASHGTPTFVKVPDALDLTLTFNDADFSVIVKD